VALGPVGPIPAGPFHLLPSIVSHRPFLALGLSWLRLGEPIGWYHLTGACGVIAGVALTTRR